MLVGIKGSHLELFWGEGLQSSPGTVGGVTHFAGSHLYVLLIRAHTQLSITCPDAGVWVCKIGLDSTVL